MLIGLTGYAGSGKDTVATYLADRYGFERRAFADRLRDLCYAQNPAFVSGSSSMNLRDEVDAWGWDQAKRGYHGVREILQNAGQAHRKVFGEDFWVDQVLPLHKGVARRALEAHIVVSDVRYPNEAKRVRDLGGYVVRTVRFGVGPVNEHESEQALPAEYVLNNSGSVADLHRYIDDLINQMKGNTC